MKAYVYQANSHADASLLQAVQQAGESCWAQGLSNGDVQPLVAAYSPQAKAYVPNHGLIEGLPMIEGAWQQAINDGLRHVAIETQEVTQDGVHGYEIGTYSILNKQGEATESGHYLIIWRLENGDWKWYRHFWNYYFPIDQRIAEQGRKQYQ